jgi:hypothetical protein
LCFCSVLPSNLSLKGMLRIPYSPALVGAASTSIDSQADEIRNATILQGPNRKDLLVKFTEGIFCNDTASYKAIY